MTPYFLTLLFSYLQMAFAQMNPVWVDIIKIFAGSIGWIGGLTWYMWSREKKMVTLAR